MTAEVIEQVWPEPKTVVYIPREDGIQSWNVVITLEEAREVSDALYRYDVAKGAE